VRAERLGGRGGGKSWGGERRREEAEPGNAWFRRQVQAGLDSANAGRLIPAAEVEARFAEKRAATRRQLKAGAS